MKKSTNSKKVTMRTMDAVLADINANVDKYNLSTSGDEKVELDLRVKALVDEYNELALLKAYADCATAANPMVAFGKMYSYKAIAVKDNKHDEVIEGVKQSVYTRIIDYKDKMLNITKFVTWMKERNTPVTYRHDWATKITEAQKELVNQWKDFIENGTAFKVTALKNTFQGMIDALVIVPTENGGNAVVVSSKNTRAIIAFCTSRKDKLIGTIAAKNTWEKLQMDILHGAVANKEFTITYSSEEAEAEADAENKAECDTTQALPNELAV